MSDIEGIASLLGEMRGQLISDETIATSLKKIISADDRDALLVIDRDTPLGMLVVNIAHKLPKREVRVDEVIVSEKARGRGVGTTLIHAAETWARNHDADIIEFTSRPSREAANHLYQKLNYNIRETNVYHKDKGEF